MNQLWIEGLAHRDFEPTLRGLLGQDAPRAGAEERLVLGVLEGCVGNREQRSCAPRVGM